MNVYKIVEKALTEYPQTRSDDRKLILAVWWLQDNRFDDDFRDFFKTRAVMPETITRCRRKIQEGGRLLATEEVEAQRYANFVDATHTKGSTVFAK